mmetsp:Transcript_107814/g.301901  ORF Transcript_107814/g.301901 Transcript_107814/m.301901 type:complete len:243 (-) Transcript_107814:22-750(-)
MRSISSLLLFGITGVTQQLVVTGFKNLAVHHRPPPPPNTRIQNVAKRMFSDDDSSVSAWCIDEPSFSSNELHNGMQEVAKVVAAMTLALLVLTVSPPAFAADYAGKTISGQDFSGQDLSGRDFNKVIAQGTNFRNANLQGANFQSASLEKADFSGANLQNAKFEDAALDGTIMKDVVAQRASFSKTILDIGDLENADLTQSLWPSQYRVMICDMNEIKGTNPVTGVDSRGSVMCNSELKYSN